MEALKKGDVVEVRTDIAPMMTLKTIGIVRKVSEKTNTLVLEDKKGNKLGTYKLNSEDIKKRS